VFLVNFIESTFSKPCVTGAQAERSEVEATGDPANLATVRPLSETSLTEDDGVEPTEIATPIRA
jgi:hypothetical protein